METEQILFFFAGLFFPATPHVVVKTRRSRDTYLGGISRASKAVHAHGPQKSLCARVPVRKLTTCNAHGPQKVAAWRWLSGVCDRGLEYQRSQPALSAAEAVGGFLCNCHVLSTGRGTFECNVTGGSNLHQKIPSKGSEGAPELRRADKGELERLWGHDNRSGASARTAGARSSGSITARGATTGTAGARAPVIVTARGAGSRTAGARPSATITAPGAHTRTSVARVSGNMTAGRATVGTAGRDHLSS